MIEIKKFDVADYLKTEEDIVEYLKVVSQEKNPDLLIKAIGDVARAKSINKILSDSTYKENAVKIAESFKNSSGAKGAADKIIKVCNDRI